MPKHRSSAVVRDTSGAVLPGVTVEAASPALIEKVRSVVTDGTGQYRIENLRPGSYTVTFTLPGFATVKREGIELTGSFVATVNGDMRVGRSRKRSTVTGETPVVDVQSTIAPARHGSRDSRHHSVRPHAVQPRRPDSGRRRSAAARTSADRADRRRSPSLRVHGSKAADSVETMSGMSISVLSTGTHQPVRVNPAGSQEVVLDTASGDAEFTVGGVRIHRIPREGGNAFNGTFFGCVRQRRHAGQQPHRRSARPRPADARLDQDELGDQSRFRRSDQARQGCGSTSRRARCARTCMRRDCSENKNLNNPNAWTYEPDLVQAGFNEREQDDAQVNLTWQASTRNKLNFVWQEAVLCWCPQSARLTSALEAEPERSYPQAAHHAAPVDQSLYEPSAARGQRRASSGASATTSRGRS